MGARPSPPPPCKQLTAPARPAQTLPAVREPATRHPFPAPQARQPLLRHPLRLFPLPPPPSASTVSAAWALAAQRMVLHVIVVSDGIPWRVVARVCGQAQDRSAVNPDVCMKEETGGGDWSDEWESCQRNCQSKNERSGTCQGRGPKDGKGQGQVTQLRRNIKQHRYKQTLGEQQLPSQELSRFPASRMLAPSNAGAVSSMCLSGEKSSTSHR